MLKTEIKVILRDESRNKSNTSRRKIKHLQGFEWCCNILTYGNILIYINIAAALQKRAAAVASLRCRYRPYIKKKNCFFIILSGGWIPTSSGLYNEFSTLWGRNPTKNARPDGSLLTRKGKVCRPRSLRSEIGRFLPAAHKKE